MTALQQLSHLYISRGWQIASIGDGQAVFSKQDGLSDAWILAGLIGLFFGILPGILILIIGYLGRKTHTRLVTDQEAELILKSFGVRK